MKTKVLLIVFMFLSVLTYGQENCNNGIDDDADGKIDLNDSDCICTAGTSGLIANSDFEQLNFCPFDFAQMTATSNWFLPNTATSDYINSCGFVPASAIDGGIYPLPQSNGSGVGGILLSQDYKEYLAACTTSPMIAGTKYQLNFDIASSSSGRIMAMGPNVGQVCNDGILNAGKLTLALYGKPGCSPTTPATTNATPSGWFFLGTATYLPSKNWTQLSMVFTPTIDLNSVMIGSHPSLPNTYLFEDDYQSCFPYFYLDNVIVEKVSILGLRISASGTFCDNTLTLNAELEAGIGTGYTYQWYKNGIALPGATGSSLAVPFQASAIGNYQVKITKAGTCKISPYYNVNTVSDVPEYTIDQGPCFPGAATITITTPADEYSFDNGATWNTTASKSGLTAYYNPIKILTRKNGCVSNARYVILTYPPVETVNTPPVVTVVQPGCQTNGSITVTTPAQEYSFDDGATWSTNSTLSNLPANQHHDYRVRIKTMLGCITTPAVVIMLPFYLPEPEFTTENWGCGNKGRITITTSAHEYSINGGATWSANPDFTNLTPGNYSVVIRNALNCKSATISVEVETTYLSPPIVSVTQPSCGILGTVTVLTPALQYSFDDGHTWTTNNTQTNLTPDYYYFIRIRESPDCISQPEVVNLSTFVWEPDITYTIINPSCSSNGSIAITTPALEYSIDGGVTWSANSLFNNLGEDYYFITIRNGIDCESSHELVHLTDFVNLTPAYTITDAGCNTLGSIAVSTIADYYSFDNGTTWSQNNTISNLSAPHIYQIMIKNISNCTSQAASVNFTSSYSSPPVAMNYQGYICDESNDGTEKINLSDYNMFLINNHQNHTFFYFDEITDAEQLNLPNRLLNITNYPITEVSTPVFVAVVTSANCYTVVQLSFSLSEVPSITSIPDVVILCENSNVQVFGGSGFDHYLWSEGSITNSLLITQPGEYSLTVSKNHGSQLCSSIKHFKVELSNPANISNILTTDLTDNNNTIEIMVSGEGNYQYSLDDSEYQSSNIFTNLPAGFYNVHIRDISGCGKTTADVALLMYPKFFTPNNDGYNDTWGIQYSFLEPGISVKIFDRYGKFIKQLVQSDSWDGRYNGADLPSDDYWFILTRKNGKEYKNHFSLRR